MLEASRENRLSFPGSKPKITQVAHLDFQEASLKRVHANAITLCFVRLPIRGTSGRIMRHISCDRLQATLCDILRQDFAWKRFVLIGDRGNSSSVNHIILGT